MKRDRHLLPSVFLFYPDYRFNYYYYYFQEVLLAAKEDLARLEESIH